MYIWNPRDRLTMFEMVIAAYNLENTSKFCNVLQFFLRIHTIGAFKREFHFTDAIHLFSYTNFESCDEQIIECSVFSWKFSESAMNVILDKNFQVSFILASSEMSFVAFMMWWIMDRRILPLSSISISGQSCPNYSPPNQPEYNSKLSCKAVNCVCQPIRTIQPPWPHAEKSCSFYQHQENVFIPKYYLSLCPIYSFYSDFHLDNIYHILIMQAHDTSNVTFIVLIQNRSFICILAAIQLILQHTLQIPLPSAFIMQSIFIRTCDSILSIDVTILF